MHHICIARDGTPLAWREMGQGRPVILLHGLFSCAQVNWIKYGHAQRIADAGLRVIMPDLRSHGHSGAPHDPAAYPDDVLAHDLLDLVASLGLDDYDLAGFSLGARTAVRGVLAGARPRRLVLAGMGLAGLAGWAARRDFFLRVIDRSDDVKRGEAEWLAVQFLKTMGTDRVAARLLMQSMADTSADQLDRITMPTLVICGADDDDNGSAPELAAALPDARLVEVTGTHMSSVTQAALGEGIARFLAY